MVINIIHTKIRNVLFTVLLILLMASTSVAATYYVDNNNARASDSNSGSESSPFKTVQKGVNVAIAGDTVYVKAGTYYEYITGKNSGKSGAPITFKKYGNDIVTIDGSKHTEYRVVLFQLKDYIIWDGIDVANGSTTGIWFKGKYNTIQNCRIYNNGTMGSNGATGITVTESDNTIVRNNEVYNNGWNGINVQSSNNSTVEYNISHGNTSHVGIQLFQDTSQEPTMFRNNNMRYNLVYNNETGIYLRYQEYNEISNNIAVNNIQSGMKLGRNANYPDKSVWESHSKIFNNTFANNGVDGITNEWATHLIIKNNIFANNSGYAIDDQQPSAGHIIDNNLYYNNSNGLLRVAKQYRYTSLSSVQATGHEANGLSGNPLFSDANNNFSLQSGSAAVDTGADLLSEVIAPYKDFEGTLRPQDQYIDIGAYEFGAPNISLTPPKNLRIETFQ